MLEFFDSYELECTPTMDESMTPAVTAMADRTQLSSEASRTKVQFQLYEKILGGIRYPQRESEWHEVINMVIRDLERRSTLMDKLRRRK